MHERAVREGGLIRRLGFVVRRLTNCHSTRALRFSPNPRPLPTTEPMGKNKKKFTGVSLFDEERGRQPEALPPDLSLPQDMGGLSVSAAEFVPGTLRRRSATLAPCPNANPPRPPLHLLYPGGGGAAGGGGGGVAKGGGGGGVADGEDEAVPMAAMDASEAKWGGEAGAGALQALQADERQANVDQALGLLLAEGPSRNRESAAVDVAACVKAFGVASLWRHGILDAIRRALEDEASSE